MTSSEKVSVLFAGQELVLEYGFASAIQKEFSRLDDGTITSEKHSITIRGAFTADGNTPESRYENLIQKSVEYADFKGSQLVDRMVSLQAGPLEIYKMTLVGDTFQTTGQPLIKYNFAQLMNVSVSEPPEDTAGIHYQEVTFTFESLTPPTDNIASKYRLKSASEQFEIKKEEDKMSFFVMNTDSMGIIRQLADDPYYSYTITHTLSAQGQPMFYNAIDNKDYSNSVKVTTASPAASPSNFSNNQKYEAFYEAYKYVNDKKRDSLINSIVSTDVFGRPLVGQNTFYPVGWNVTNVGSGAGSPAFGVSGVASGTNSFSEVVTSGGMISNLLWSAVSGQQHAAGASNSGKYGEYNVIRSSNIDIIGGSYSITTNYFYSRNPANIEINGVFEKGEDGDDTVRVEGTIQGLDSLGVNSDTQNKFKNAQILFRKLISSGVIHPSTNSPTIQSGTTDKINYPENYTQIKPVYPSSIYAAGSGNVIINPPFTGVMKDQSVESDKPSYLTNTIIKPWAYGTMVYAFADDIFRNNQYASYYQVDNVLDWKPMSTSVTENKIAGSIQFSATYKGIPETVRSLRSSFGALSVTIQEQQENWIADYTNPSDVKPVRTQHVVPVMVLGRERGPIIQDMSTTKESKRTIQIEAIYAAEHRHPKAPIVASGLSAAMNFIPTGVYNQGIYVNSYLTDLNYTWDWTAGKLSITAGWIFTKP